MRRFCHVCFIILMVCYSALGWAGPILPTPDGSTSDDTRPLRVWRAQDLVNALGVNTHLNNPYSPYRNNSVKVLAALSYLGINNIRDQIYWIAWINSVWNTTKAVLSAGIKEDININCCDMLPGFPTVMSSAQAILVPMVLAYPDSLIGIEGWNEPNISTASYGGYTGNLAVDQLQIDLWNMVKSDPHLKGIKVLGPALNSPPYNQISYEGLYDANPAVIKAFDIPTVHDYMIHFWERFFSHQMLVTSVDIGYTKNKDLPLIFGPWASQLAHHQEWVTETGIRGFKDQPLCAAAHNNTVSYQAQSIAGVDSFLDLFSQGIARAWLYELADFKMDPLCNRPGDHWGIYDNQWNAKPFATVIHNITTALHDPGATATTFTPTQLSISVPQFPLHPPGTPKNGSGFTLVTQSSNGTYKIFVWYEPNVAKTEPPYSDNTPPATEAITLKLSGAACRSASVYDPYTNISTPITPMDGGSSLPVSLPWNAVIVTCKP